MSIIMQTILKASFTAGTATLAVILLRITMKRLPKRWSYILWAVVFFRCLCPFSAGTAVSIFNLIPTESTESQVSVPEAVYDFRLDNIPYFIGIDAGTWSGAAGAESPISLNTVIFILWAAGVLVMIWYAVISYASLMQKVRAAVKMPDGAYETDMISTAFTAGFFAPKIYLPCGLSENDRRLIIAHERVHIRRLDFIWKPIAFAGLALHWFNPLIWAAFALMSKDMELSCDEAVLDALGWDEKEDYSEALLKVSVKKSGLASAPAFAETGVKDRVRNVLEYRKPGAAMTVLAAVLVVSSCAVLGTNAIEGPIGDDSTKAYDVMLSYPRGEVEDFYIVSDLPPAAEYYGGMEISEAVTADEIMENAQEDIVYVFYDTETGDVLSCSAADIFFSMKS